MQLPVCFRFSHLCACLALCIVTVTSHADLIQGYYYYTTNAVHQATITHFNSTYSGALVITNKLGGFPVISIGPSAFSSCHNMTSVTIPDGVTSIGKTAFAGCGGLASVFIAPSVISIGDAAFNSCMSLKSVIIPNSVTNVGGDTFFCCYSLSNVTIPDSVKNIGSRSFEQCTNLTNVTIGNGVGSIGSLAFDGCSSLTRVVVGNSVSNISDSAFLNCTSLSQVCFLGNAPTKTGGTTVFHNDTSAHIYYLPESSGWGTSFCGRPAYEWYFFWCVINQFNTNTVTLIGYDGPDSALVIPTNVYGKTVTNIGTGAFYRCSWLTSVTIPESVKSVGPGAFYSCPSLTSVTISGSVTNIGNAAFQYCPVLTGVYLKGNAPHIGYDLFDFATNSIIYYLPETTGWENTFGDHPARPAFLWNPQVQAGSGFGVNGAGRFGFNILGTNSMAVSVESCTSLASAVWVPNLTVTLNNGTAAFSDVVSTNYPAQFYRLRMP